MKDKIYYQNLNYPITVGNFIDEGEIVFFAEIKELEGLKIYGDSYDEVINELIEAKEGWIEFNLDQGRYIPEPYQETEASGRITLRLTKKLHQEIKIKSQMEGVSINLYLNDIIQTGLRAYDMNSIRQDLSHELNKMVSIVSRGIVTTMSSTNKFLLDRFNKPNLINEKYVMDITDDENTYPAKKALSLKEKNYIVWGRFETSNYR